jgi:hypothetical protein
MHASTTAAMQEGSANPSAGVPRLHMVVMDDVELDGLTSQTSASSKAFPWSLRDFSYKDSKAVGQGRLISKRAVRDMSGFHSHEEML